jgi:hypothetical protein
MSVVALLKAVKADTEGPETSLRVVGTRETPARMSLQIQVTGAAKVQIQGRIARDAPWVNVGEPYSMSALAFIDPVQFLRAVSTGMIAGSSVSVWAVWAW